MKSKVVATRISPKQKLAHYRTAALAFIASLRYPTTQSFFSVKGYEKTPTGPKPNVINVPELLAIVGTARALGKQVVISSSGVDMGGQIDVSLVDVSNKAIPSELI
jgi:hypothetical protein